MVALPDNEALEAFARDVSWQTIEETHEQFQEYLNGIRSKLGSHPLAADMFWDLTQPYAPNDPESPDGNVLLSKGGARPFEVATILGKRFQQSAWIDYIRPYNLNPAVIHTNLHEAGGPLKIRPVGTELEVGLIRADGQDPTLEDLKIFHAAYVPHARWLEACLDVAPELCIYQAEVTIPPAFGYSKILRQTELNIAALTRASNEVGLRIAIMSVYPTETDFATSKSDKVEMVALFLDDINQRRPRQCELLAALQRRFRITRGSGRPSNVLRFQGYHLHVDIAGRSEALGMISYVMNLGSASSIANHAMLRGGPFMDGMCDPDLLCVREYVRAISITGHYVGQPVSPHLETGGMERHARLLRENLANATGRALLYGEEDGMPFSGMHNMLGRVRPDLASSTRICTLENTGLSSNPSAERLAAIATDYQYSQLAIEHYFRRHGMDLHPMFDDREFLDVFGPLDKETFLAMSDQADRLCSDMQIKTAGGAVLSLLDFYEKKRRLLKRLLGPLNVIDTRDIDGLYDRIYHFLAAPNGAAMTIDDFINHPTRRGTGNWGRILRDAFVEAGGTVGAKDPASSQAVQQVVEELNAALMRRYA